MAGFSQAKQLQVDIQRSQEIAREVVDQAQNGQKLEERVEDASSKVDLLHGEIFFNESLGATLERVQIIQRELELVQRATLDNRLEEAVDLITQAHEDLASLSAIRSTKILNILEAKTTDLRSLVREKLTDSWNQQVCVNAAMNSVQVNPKADGTMTKPPLIIAIMLIFVRPMYGWSGCIGHRHDQTRHV